MSDVVSLFDEQEHALLPESSMNYSALNLLNMPVWIFDIDRKRVVWANPAALNIWDAATLPELLARDLGLDMSAAVSQRLLQYQQDFLQNPQQTFSEQWTLYPNNKPVVTHVLFSGHRLIDGRMAMLCEARPLDDHAPESRRSVEALLHTSVMITLYAKDGAPLYRNPAARSAIVNPEETLHTRIQHSNQDFSLQSVLSAEQMGSFSIPVDTPQGRRWHEISARVCKDAATGEEAILVSETDITSVKDTEARANHLAMHDTLTGLPNRSHAIEQFARIATNCQQTDIQAAFLFIDLDRFKDVNDSLGHGAGDALLIEISERLRQLTKPTDLLARLGGDEFLLVRQTTNLQEEVEKLKIVLMSAIALPVHIDGLIARVTPSIGVARYPADGATMDELLRHADLAMYSAKEAGRNNLAYYRPEMSEQVVKRVELENDLRLAFERKEFVLYYQPRVSVKTGKILGVEALVRWQHPVKGLIFPDSFIPVCETNGLIQQLGKEVLTMAIRQQVAWAQEGFDLSMAINVSPHQIRDSGLFDEIVKILIAEKCNPTRIELEITESTLLGNDQQVHQFLKSVESLGISIALDDFGVGYSNLIYLQQFPIKTLKIDKSFIQGLKENQALAGIVVSMCRLMRFTAVAEGVETPEQMNWVTEQGVDEFQGYYFSRPVPKEEIRRLLAQQFGTVS